MTTLTDILIGWGSLNAFIVVVPLAIAHRRGAFIRRTSRNVTTAADRMLRSQRYEWQ